MNEGNSILYVVISHFSIGKIHRVMVSLDENDVFLWNFLLQKFHDFKEFVFFLSLKGKSMLYVSEKNYLVDFALYLYLLENSLQISNYVFHLPFRYKDTGLPYHVIIADVQISDYKDSVLWEEKGLVYE